MASSEVKDAEDLLEPTGEEIQYDDLDANELLNNPTSNTSASGDTLDLTTTENLEMAPEVLPVSEALPVVTQTFEPPVHGNNTNDDARKSARIAMAEQKRIAEERAKCLGTQPGPSGQGRTRSKKKQAESASENEDISDDEKEVSTYGPSGSEENDSDDSESDGNDDHENREHHDDEMDAEEKVRQKTTVYNQNADRSVIVDAIPEEEYFRNNTRPAETANHVIERA